MDVFDAHEFDSDNIREIKSIAITLTTITSMELANSLGNMTNKVIV